MLPMLMPLSPTSGSVNTKQQQGPAGAPLPTAAENTGSSCNTNRNDTSAKGSVSKAAVPSAAEVEVVDITGDDDADEAADGTESSKPKPAAAAPFKKFKLCDFFGAKGKAPENKQTF